MGLLSLLLLVSSFSQSVGTESGNARNWLVQAQQHLQRQEWDESRQAALKALEIDPRLGDAEVLLGLVATAQSKFQEAQKHFLKAISLQPRNPRAHAYLGSTYLQQKRFSEAAVSFRKVLELNPGNPTASYNLGLIALLQEKPAEALPYFERVHQAHSSDVPPLIGVLESQLLLKRKPEAARSAQKLQALLEPRDPRLFQVATMLAVHGDYASAIPIMERVQQAFPQSYDVNYNLALAYFRSRQYDTAAQSLQPLLNQPRRAEAYNLLGSVEEERNRPAEAVRAFQKAAELEPGQEDFRFDYANALLQIENVRVAADAFTAGARDFPKSWRMLLGLGATNYILAEHDEAAAKLLEAIKIDPGVQLTYYLLGHTYDPVPAMQPMIADVFSRYVQQEPNDPWAYCHYGTILFRRAQAEGQQTFEEAKSHLRKALDLKPSFPEAHLQLGIIAQSERRFEEAVESLQRAIELNPSLAAAHYRLGLAYQRLGEKEKARAELDLFQKLKSENEAAQRNTVIESLSQQRK
jgi:tetratricopeptide (TPR) repeat protein